MTICRVYHCESFYSCDVSILIFYREILELDLALPAEKVRTTGDIAVTHINAIVSELRRLFLVEDFVDSVKFGFCLWMLTYLGSWFNGMTLIILGRISCL